MYLGTQVKIWMQEEENSGADEKGGQQREVKNPHMELKWIAIPAIDLPPAARFTSPKTH